MQPAGETEAGDRASLPEAASAGASTRVRQLPPEGAQVEHDQGGEPDILGALETYRCGS